MSQSIPTGYTPPRQSLGISSKTCPGGRDLTFRSCPRGGGGREFDKGRDFVKNESETSKNCLDQIFTGKKTQKKQVEFLTIFEVCVFSQRNFASSIGRQTNFGSSYTLQKSEELPLACLCEVFTGVMVIHTHVLHKKL